MSDLTAEQWEAFAKHVAASHQRLRDSAANRAAPAPPTLESVTDALEEVVRILESDEEMIARSALHFTAWDIARRTLRGETYPWGMEPWRNK
jgi:hypothetical protein